MGRARPAFAALVVLAAGLVLAGCAPAVAGLPGVLRPPAPIAQAPSGTQGEGAPRPHSDEPSLAESGAFTVGTGTEVTIELWVDYFCPYCRMFEEANGDFLESIVDDGQAALLIHPISFLDRAAMGTKYSTRAANATACVAESAPDDYWAYHRRLYAEQPEEGTEGLSDDELVHLAPGIADVEDCIHEQWFSDWITRQTQDAVENGVQSTPTVTVNGVQYRGPTGDGASFRRFVESANAKV